MKEQDSVIKSKDLQISELQSKIKAIHVEYTETLLKLAAQNNVIKDVSGELVENSALELSKRSKFGLGLGYDWDNQQTQLLISYTLKNDWQFIYEFQLPITKSDVIVQSANSLKFMVNF